MAEHTEPNPAIVVAGALSVLAIPFIARNAIAQANAPKSRRLTRLLRRR
jgi:hypothetical protein